tara:strand:- start:3875 stop:4018 length:144 start_codon:yes stop_codon:yes gene_type:complete
MIREKNDDELDLLIDNLLIQLQNIGISQDIKFLKREVNELLFDKERK